MWLAMNGYISTISIQEASKDPIFQSLTITHPLLSNYYLLAKLYPPLNYLKALRTPVAIVVVVLVLNRITSVSIKILNLFCLRNLHLFPLRMQVVQFKDVLYGGSHTSIWVLL